MWSNGGTSSSVTVTSGSYTVTVSDASGCTGTAQVSVNSFPPMNLNISGTLSYCTGSNTTITANNGSIYIWNDAANSTSASITVSQGTYTVTATDANNCTAIATATVIENQPPTITFQGALNYCTGESANITAVGGVSYLWSTGNATASVVLTQGTYTVTATDANGCSNSGSVTITENAGAIADFSFEPKCAGQEVLFQNLSSGASSFLWNFGNGETSVDFSPAIAYQNGGNYNVTLVALAGNCSDTLIQTITISGKPKADFTAEKTTLVQGEETLSLTNLSTDADLWIWNFGDGTISNEFEPNHFYAQKGRYTVSLIALNAGGCLDTLTRNNWVNVIEKPSLFVPNLFSPNDDGVNDIFKAEGTGFKQMELKIFNRWGEKIFETEKAEFGWDGFVGGAKAEPGVYVYHLSVTYEVLSTQKVSGTVVLMR